MNIKSLIEEVNSILELFKQNPTEDNVECLLGEGSRFVTALQSVYLLDVEDQLPFLNEAEKIRRQILAMVIKEKK